MPLTSEERRARAKLAAHTRWAKERDRSAATAPARAAQLRQFEDQVDPNHELSSQERAKRVENARQAHLLRMALASAKARRLRKAGGASATT